MIGMIDRMAGLRHASVLAQSKHLSKSTPRAHFSRFPFIPLYTRGTRTARVLLASTCVYAQLYAIHINNTVCVCSTVQTMGPRLPLELIARSLSSYLLEDQAIRIKAAAPTSLLCLWLTAAPFAATSFKHSTFPSVTLEFCGFGAGRSGGRRRRRRRLVGLGYRV
jgi:hypothetical protein